MPLKFERPNNLEVFKIRNSISQPSKDLGIVTKLPPPSSTHIRRPASGYKSLKLRVTAQRKERKSAVKVNEEYKNFTCDMVTSFM